MADVFRHFGPAFRDQHGASLSAARWRAMTAIESCRTAALGGHVERCDDCGHQRIAYNSCRNRNCPKCQGLARAQWLEERQAELLDVPYFHVVFTVPDIIATIAFQNQTVVYDILFRAAAETLRTIAAEPKHLGAEIGFLGVLHTWGQNLLHHPHIHFLVPGGGIAPDGESWVACRPGFFLPVRVLSRMFRGLFLHGLEKAFAAGELNFFSAHRHLHEPAAFRRYVAPAWKADWVVYAKRPFAGPEQVLDYVGRYTTASPGPKSAWRFQIHHDPGSALQPHEPELPMRSGWGRLCSDSHQGPRTGAKWSDPGRDDGEKARLPRFMPSTRRPECSDGASAKDPAANNAHSPGGTGSSLAQHVFRSPARIQLRSPREMARAPRRQAKNAVRYVALSSEHSDDRQACSSIGRSLQISADLMLHQRSIEHDAELAGANRRM